MNEYQLHPLCTLFPRMTGQEFQSLADDIKANGQREPIILHEGMILDGGNRYRACLEAGVEPSFMEFGGENLVSYVLSANLHRRHMTPGQQAAIVASAQDWASAHGRGGDRKSNQSQAVDFDTVEKRAAASGVSGVTQMKADKVAKEDPELAKKVAQGEVSLPEAVKKVSPKKETKRVVEEDFQEESDQKDQEILELSDTIVSLEDENQRLKDAIATGQLPEEEIQSAAEIIDGLRKKVKALEDELDATRSTRDALMIKNAQLEKQCLINSNKLKKAGIQ